MDWILDTWTGFWTHGLDFGHMDWILDTFGLDFGHFGLDFGHFWTGFWTLLDWILDTLK